MRMTIVLAVALAALALGASTAAAAEKPSLADQVAARLGVSAEQLRAAFKATLTARVDAAVAAGKLTPEQGAKLKERIANAKGLGLGGKHRFAKKQQALVKRIGVRAKRLGAASEYLGLTRERIRAELKAGKSLAQIAAARGKTADGLATAMLAPVKDRLAKAVAAKRLTRERADEILERLDERLGQRIHRTRPARS
jgi:hypothetical protein